MSLGKNIQDLIDDMRGSLENHDNKFKDEEQLLSSQLVCLQRKVNKQMLLLNGSKPKLSENITSVMSEKKVEHY